MNNYQSLSIACTLLISTAAFAADEELKKLVPAEEAAAIEKASNEKSKEKPVEEDASKDSANLDEEKKESEAEEDSQKAEDELARKELSRPYRTLRQGIEPSRQLSSPPGSALTGQ